MNNANPDDALVRAQELAHRYRCEFVNLRGFTINSVILKRVPVDLMFRYRFVPLEETRDGGLAIAIADPSQLGLLDEIRLLLGTRLVVRVAALGQIIEVLHGSDPNPTPMAPPDEPQGPSAPDAPVRAPRKPKPRSRSSAARAVPEDEQ